MIFLVVYLVGVLFSGCVTVSLLRKYQDIAVSDLPLIIVTAFLSWIPIIIWTGASFIERYQHKVLFKRKD